MVTVTPSRVMVEPLLQASLLVAVHVFVVELPKCFTSAIVCAVVATSSVVMRSSFCFMFILNGAYTVLITLALMCYPEKQSIYLLLIDLKTNN
jgi:hypothetical protein